MDKTPVCTQSSRRVRLWELEHKCHCPVVGVCFSLEKIRLLVSKMLHVTPQTSDFEIHVTAVRESASRSALAELLQRNLDRQYALSITRFKAARTTEALEVLWQQSLAVTDVAGPLWAVLTHPRCTPDLTQKIYGDIHMLQHQVGAGDRADLVALRHLRQENVRLTRELARVQDKLTALRQEQATEMEQLKHQLAINREETLGYEQAAARHFNALIMLQDNIRKMGTPISLARRAQQAESRCTALGARISELEAQLSSSQKENRQLSGILASRTPVPRTESRPLAGDDALSGRSVLCVGGRVRATSLYRNMVERMGGRFIHHDGGLEENMARLEGSIASADAVICQAGCISHNAYWRVKEQCKRTGKPCLYLKTPSLSGFVRSLEHLVTQECVKPNPQSSHQPLQEITP